MNLLFLSGWFPYPPDNGSKIRILNLLRGLSGRHRVSLISFYDSPPGERQMEALRSLCQDIHGLPSRSFSPCRPRALLGFFSPTPRSLLDTHSPPMAQAIREQVRKRVYDLVIASEITMAAYWKAFAPLPALLEDLELGALATGAGLRAWSPRRLRRMLTWLKVRRYVAHLLPHFRACTVVSTKEKELLHQVAPHYRNVAVIPNGVDLSSYGGIVVERQRKRLIFPGSLTYPANDDAVRFFLKEVLPRILQEEPETSLVITGRFPRQLSPLPPSVHLTGWVEDVRPWIAGSWVTIVPLRQGGGTRLKVLESLALGTPVVATSKGAEGIEGEAGRHFLLADDPPSLAAAVLRLLRDEALWHSLSEQGRQLVGEKYDWGSVLPRFLDLVEECAR